MSFFVVQRLISRLIFKSKNFEISFKTREIIKKEIKVSPEVKKIANNKTSLRI